MNASPTAWRQIHLHFFLPLLLVLVLLPITVRNDIGPGFRVVLLDVFRRGFHAVVIECTEARDLRIKRKKHVFFFKNCERFWKQRGKKWCRNKAPKPWTEITTGRRRLSDAHLEFRLGKGSHRCRRAGPARRHPFLWTIPRRRTSKWMSTLLCWKELLCCRRLHRVDKIRSNVSGSV